LEKRNPNSAWKPYIGNTLNLIIKKVTRFFNVDLNSINSDILPTSFDATIFWSDNELDFVKGTNLYGHSFPSSLIFIPAQNCYVI
jgi:hypothetical protein